MQYMRESTGYYELITLINSDFLPLQEREKGTLRVNQFNTINLTFQHFIREKERARGHFG